MPTYTTPTPIDLAINLPVGAIEIVASDRTDTVVTVSPTNPAKAVDRRGAEETKVDFDGQRLTIIGPKPRISFDRPDRVGRREGRAADRFAAHRRGRGRRRPHRRSPRRHPHQGSMGPVDVDATGDLWLRAGHGNATVGSADGGVEITADHGQIRVGTVTGDADPQGSHGTDPDRRVRRRPRREALLRRPRDHEGAGSVTAKTAYGSIQLREVSSGSVQLESGYGQVTIGVRPGVPAWLDLSSKDGHVRNELDGDRAPDAAEQTVAVRARTQYGDITIQRAR